MKKLRSNRGFTLTETLLTVLILSLVTAAVAAGVVTARDVYNKIRLTADAQTLASTAINAITEDLESGTDFRYQEDEGVTYLVFHSASRGYRMYYKNGGSAGESNQGIHVVGLANHTVVPLLTDKTESLNLRTEVTFEPYTENSDHVWFTVTVKDSENIEREKDTVCVRLLAEI